MTEKLRIEAVFPDHDDPQQYILLGRTENGVDVAYMIKERDLKMLYPLLRMLGTEERKDTSFDMRGNADLLDS